MALFTDGPIHTSGEFKPYDTAVLNVASSEGIDVTVKAQLAQDEIATELLLFLQRNSISDPQSLARRCIGVGDIVVTPPLKRWHAYKTLELVYRDAHSNQLNGRYQGKLTEYKRLVRDASNALFEAGIGIVGKPVPKAGQPLLTATPGNFSGAQYYLRTSWIGTSGQEGALS